MNSPFLSVNHPTPHAPLMRRTRGKCQATAGNRGVMVLRRLHGFEAEFSVMSFWDSLDDVKAFAGEDVDAARYFPDDERFLLDFPPRLKHFEVARER